MEKLKEVAHRYIQGRRRLKELKTMQQDAMSGMGALQKDLHEAFGAANFAPAAAELASFTIAEGDVCYTFIFCDGKLQSLVEGPKL